jgi:hypothetical protein
LGILPNEAETVLARSISRFNGAFVNLRESPLVEPNSAKRIEADWAQLRDMVTVAPTKSALIKVDSLAESLLVSAEALTTALSASLTVPSASLTNLAGRQRMLSQRMSKAAFGLIWGAEARAYGPQYDTARGQLLAALSDLQRAKANSTAIQRSLEMAEIQAGLFEAALGSRADLSKLTPQRAVNVAKTSERLLELFDDLTKLYSVSAA